MSKISEKIEDFHVVVNEERIFRHIGYKKKSSEFDENIRELISEEKKKLDDLLQPAAIYAILDYEKTNKHPIFKNAEKVALCICTIGPKLEEEIRELMDKNELLRAWILDALGSEAVEEVAIQSDGLLARKARELNLWPSKRFSPGYKRWDIREQRFVFDVLPAQNIGVSLIKDSCMMVPRKSISFRVNYYKEQKYSTRKY